MSAPENEQVGDNSPANRRSRESENSSGSLNFPDNDETIKNQVPQKASNESSKSNKSRKSKDVESSDNSKRKSRKSEVSEKSRKSEDADWYSGSSNEHSKRSSKESSKVVEIPMGTPAATSTPSMKQHQSVLETPPKHSLANSFPNTPTLRKSLPKVNLMKRAEEEPLIRRENPAESTTHDARTSRDDFLEKTILTSSKNPKVIYERKYVPKKPLKQNKLIMNDEVNQKMSKLTKKKVKLYKTSVEKWRPGGSKIVCVNCGVKARPVIKSRASRLTNSRIGASLILTCWPFCFFPCLFTPPTEECLHCAVCNFFLGMYDHQKEMLTPNQDVVGSS